MQVHTELRAWILQRVGGDVFVRDAEVSRRAGRARQRAFRSLDTGNAIGDARVQLHHLFFGVPLGLMETLLTRVEPLSTVFFTNLLAILGIHPELL